VPESVPSFAISALEIGTKATKKNKASIDATITLFIMHLLFSKRQMYLVTLPGCCLGSQQEINTPARSEVGTI
jgi:hypothetical protein